MFPAAAPLLIMKLTTVDGQWARVTVKLPSVGRLHRLCVTSSLARCVMFSTVGGFLNLRSETGRIYLNTCGKKNTTRAD